MPTVFRKATLAGALVMVLGASSASADPLLYVTASTIGLVQSTAPGLDLTPGGPMTFHLPAGYSVVGADLDPQETDTVGVLGRNGGTCQLFGVSVATAGGIAPALGAAYACTGNAADIDFVFPNTNGQSEYYAAAGDHYYDAILSGTNPSLTVNPVAGANGAAADLAAIAIVPILPTNQLTVLGIDRNYGGVIAFQGPPVQELPLVKLGFPLTGNVSLDSGWITQRLFVTSGGTLYQATYSDVIKAVGNHASGSPFTALGTVPVGTIAIVANSSGFFPDVTSSSSSSGSSSSGAGSSGGTGSSGSSSSSGGGPLTGTSSGGGAALPMDLVALAALALRRRKWHQKAE